MFLKKYFDHNIWNNEKRKQCKQAFLTLFRSSHRIDSFLIKFNKKFRKIHRKTPVPGLGLQLYSKRDSGTGVFLWILRIFLKTPILQNSSGWLLLSIKGTTSSTSQNWNESDLLDLAMPLHVFFFFFLFEHFSYLKHQKSFNF